MEVLRPPVLDALGSAPRALLALRQWLALAALCFAPLASAQSVSKEDQVKAVFLFRLAQFVQWPTNAFPSPQSPLVIGVLGQNPFGRSLEFVVQDESAHGRSLHVVYLDGASDPAACHILFISRSESAQVRQVLARLRQKSILTVSDLPEGFLENGGIVHFRTEDNKIKMTINADAAAAAGLVPDARLLRIADVIKRSGP